jgi:hypothetical protein
MLKPTCSYAWLGYDEAIKFVHQLKIKSEPEWRDYCRGLRPDLKTKPADIPTAPSKLYDGEFQKRGGWGAWLGTDYIATARRGYRPYNEAVRFVHSLNLKSGPEWYRYCKGLYPDLPALPHDIPHDPHVYRSEFKQHGWSGWLNTKKRPWVRPGKRANWRPFDEAVKFVRQLKLRNRDEWLAYCNGERRDLPPKPGDIPRRANDVYGTLFKENGGWGGWVGSEIRKGGWLTYDEAVKFTSALGLKSSDEWYAYTKGRRSDLPAIPFNIPKNPRGVYEKEFIEKGGMGAWLETGNVFQREWLPYGDAAAFVHTLGFRREEQWREYAREERDDLPSLPNDIPKSPSGTYGEKFYKEGGWGAWLRNEPRYRKRKKSQ